ncbi:hypothetical protein OQA88_4478 [Cercophora sp. LCS_1]
MADKKSKISCLSCSKTFENQSSLVRHTNSKHPGLDFNAKVEAFTLSSALISSALGPPASLLAAFNQPQTTVLTTLQAGIPGCPFTHARNDYVHKHISDDHRTAILDALRFQMLHRGCVAVPQAQDRLE